MFAVACVGDDKPTEAAARKIFDEDMTARTYKLISFRKTDGASSERDGVKRYVMECEAEVERTRDSGGSRAMFLQLPDPIPKYQFVMPLGKAGTRQNAKFQMFFEKRESGWVSVNPFR